MLKKARILWESFGRPNIEDEKYFKKIRSMPSITCIRLGDGKISIL